MTEPTDQPPYLRLDGRSWDLLQSVDEWSRRTGEGPKLGDLAALVGVSTGTVRRIIDELAEWPMLEVERHKSGRIISCSLRVSDFGRWVLQRGVVEDDEARVWVEVQG